MNISNNRQRLFAQALSLDAWHTPIRAGRSSSEVRVELAFKKGRLGGDSADFPFTFNVSLKRATLIVRIEDPLRIDKNSVARNIPVTQIQMTRVRTAREHLAKNMSAGVNVGSSSSLNFAGRASSQAEDSLQEELKIIEALPPILVAGEPRSSSEYSWTLEPTYLPTLLGQPWDPATAPRLTAVYDHTQIGKIEPIISAEVTCALEDIVIEDIVPKDPSMLDWVKSLSISDRRISAARQHIKLVLREADLDPGTMDNRFSSLLIASALSIESGK